MKKLILSYICYILLLLLTPCLAWGQDYARMNPYILGSSVPAAAGCTLDNDDSLINYITAWESGSSAPFTCTKWVPAGAVTITKYVGLLYGQTQGGIRMCLIDHDAVNDRPSSASCKADTDKYLAHDAISDSWAIVDFELATPKLVSAGTYWICSIGEGGITKSQIYHSEAGVRVSYFTSAPGDGSELADYAYAVQVYGCD